MINEIKSNSSILVKLSEAESHEQVSSALSELNLIMKKDHPTPNWDIPLIAATKLIGHLAPILAHLRANGFINLSPEEYIRQLELPAVEELVWMQDDGQYGDGFSELIIPLRNYLLSLPGYKKESLGSQADITQQNHGYSVMQLACATR